MPSFKKLHNLTDEELLQLLQLTTHPGFAAFNKLLLFQVESETADFVSRDLVDDREIVNRYKDFRGVHKAVGNVLNVIKLLVKGTTEAEEARVESEDPFDFPEYRTQ